MESWNTIDDAVTESNVEIKKLDGGENFSDNLSNKHNECSKTKGNERKYAVHDV